MTKVRYCNCSDVVIPEGIIRTLLVIVWPKLKSANTKPCEHWEAI